MKQAKNEVQKHNKTQDPKANSLELTPEYIETYKFKKWCEYFYDKTNKETYGNATQSALKVYNTESTQTAGRIGHDNLKKVENLRVTIADKEGFGYADMWRIGFSKMMAGEWTDWEKMMVRLGYFEPDPKIVAPNQTTNFVFNFNNIQEAIAASRKERGLNP